MPEFEGAENFPTPKDDLPRVPLETWGPFAFASLDPAFPFEEWIAPVRARVGWMPLERFAFDPASSRDYRIGANWALYVDNYLEELHIPHVHGTSLASLDYTAYHTELFPWGNLQFGLARTTPPDAPAGSAASAAVAGEPVFDLPSGHPDHGRPIAAFYFWLFPNLMLNFYPWGLSVNIVRPLAPDRTVVSFLSYVWEESKRSRGVGADLHRVEMEDEEVVESVQRGVRSRLYERGRYSPRREVGTHHFHRLLAGFISRGA
jgi:choline monooxygenase